MLDHIPPKFIQYGVLLIIKFMYAATHMIIITQSIHLLIHPESAHSMQMSEGCKRYTIDD